MIALEKPTDMRVARKMVIDAIFNALHKAGYVRTHALLGTLWDKSDDQAKVWMLWALSSAHHQHERSPNGQKRMADAMYIINRHGYPDVTTQFYSVLREVMPEWFIDDYYWAAVSQGDWADIGHGLDDLDQKPKQQPNMIAALRR